MSRVQSEESLPKFLDLESRVFSESKGELYLGKEKITKEMRDLLREQAKYLLKSQLWEVIHATAVNEAYSFALVQSKDYNHVLSAKMLHHWAYIMGNLMNILSKNDS